MNKILLSLATCLFLLPAYPQSGDGHRIQITLKPYQHSKVYLGYYYGKVRALADSAILDGSSTGIFAGKDKLPGGVYFVVSPERVILFEVLIDSQQLFSISADTANMPGSVTFAGSSDNHVFQAYTRFTTTKGSEIVACQKELTTTRSKADSSRLNDKIKKLNTDIQQYRENIAVQYPGSLLATLFQVLKEPVVPPTLAQKSGKEAYYFFKSHYWDGISFTDERLTRTPIFEPRLDKYFKDLVSPEPDSIEREADMMLLESRTNKAMFQFLMVYFVQKYINPQYMGQDAVFVHLFEKFINTGEAEFFTEKYRKFLNDRAYSLMVDSSGKPSPLYGINAPFTVICFWDPTCGHCKEIVPEVDSIYQAKWKQEGVKLYGVLVDGGQEAWKAFIKDHNLKDWIHVYQTKARQDSTEAAGQPGYKQLYDVYQTPILYLLDKDKRIVAKKLSYEQIEEVINLKLKNAKP
jgi:Domain of unknown function (DUF5106)/Thioredoxin-like